MKLLLTRLIIFSVGALYKKIIDEYSKQKKILKGRALRRKQIFNIKECTQKKEAYIKTMDWTKQKNRGTHPCKLDKPITKRNYAKGIAGVVKR